MDINVQFISMDVCISEQVVQNPDGSYTILLNSRLTRETLEKAYLHALEHIQNGDFEKEDVDEIEWHAHGL